MHAADDSTTLQSSYYDGQIALCPSDSAIKADRDAKTTTSVSFGVVSLYFKDRKHWRGLNQQSSSAPMGGNEADAICRQMGYTQALSESAIARDASGYTFNDC